MGGRRWTAVFVAVAIVAGGLIGAEVAASAAGAPAGFADQEVLSGLDLPTNLAFSPDGRVFVAEKAGVIKVYDSLSDPTPSVFADLSAEVYSYGDLGMTGLTLHPNFPATPYVYVTYEHDAPIGGHAPVYNDTCSAAGACTASGRVSRLTATGNTGGSEKVLVEDWCQAYYSHAIQDVKFGPDGMLYVSGGDGARVNPPDHGQYGNPCGDPTDEGGSLRAQDLRTSGDPVSLDGSVIRIDPETGAGVAGNPLFSSTDPNARRIIAEGLRNPFRYTFRPGTNEMWIGDVGWKTREEIDVLANPTDGTVDNFGWPCYEGLPHQAGWDELNLPVCENLYVTTGQVQPFFQYTHAEKTVPTGSCDPGDQGSIAAPTFYPGGSYPAHYDNGLFFADYARQCLFFMPAGTNGVPDRGRARGVLDARSADWSTSRSGPAATSTTSTSSPAPSTTSASTRAGTTRRSRWRTPTRAPVRRRWQCSSTATCRPTRTATPLTYAWDLDGDDAFDDSTAVNPTHTYTTTGSVSVRLRVTDSHNASNIATVTVNVGGGAGAPVPMIGFSTQNWYVGQPINYSGVATDPEDGAIPASKLKWSISLFHCPNGVTCHQHPQAEGTGAGGTFIAPDHEYYAYLRFTLTATDSNGNVGIATRDLQPQTRTMTLTSSPAGVTLGFNDEAVTAPFSRTVIRRSTNTISAPADAVINGKAYRFDHWSDSHPCRTHDVNPDLNTTRTAFYVLASAPPTTLPPCVPPPPPPPPPPPNPTGYWTVEANGIVTAFGGVTNYGSAPTTSVQDLESTPTGKGYWIVNASGSVYAFGDAPFKGAASGLAPGEFVTSISRTATGQGYWLFTTRGKVLSFGDAAFYGDLRNLALNGPILDSVSTPSGHGYFMVGSDGGVFAFGDAKFAGSMGGVHLNAPVQSLVPDGDGIGYWLVASDGGVFAFSAPFRGSMGSVHLNRPVSGMVRYGNGYLMVAEDGGIFNFSDQPFVGSLGSTPPATPVVSVATSS